LHCYCNSKSTFQQGSDALCRNYLQNNSYSQLLQYFAAFVVTIVNLALEVPISVGDAVFFFLRSFLFFLLFV
jgi:hypothetical protein